MTFRREKRGEGRGGEGKGGEGRKQGGEGGPNLLSKRILAGSQYSC